MYEIFEQLLQKYGISAYKVSKETGITQSTLSDWKRGRSTPKTDTMKKIADYFGVTVNYLMTGEDAPDDSARNPELSNVYFSLAKEAEQNGIDPKDIKMAIEMIKKLRGE